MKQSSQATIAILQNWKGKNFTSLVKIFVKIVVVMCNFCVHHLLCVKTSNFTEQFSEQYWVSVPLWKQCWIWTEVELVHTYRILQQKHVKHTTFHVCCLVINGYFTARVLFFLSWDKNNWCEYLQPQICPEYITPSPQVISPLDPNISSPVCNATKKCLQTFLSPALIFRILRSLVAR